MKQLSSEQVNFIAKKIESGEIQSKELHDDLLDHFCCVIEDRMNKGEQFDEAFEKACLQICPDGLGEIQNELLTSKSIRFMKKSTIVLGIIAISTSCAGAWFKMCHWPAANILIFIAILSIVFGFLPLYFMYMYKQDITRHSSPKAKNIFGYISISLIAIACTCKVFHIPGTMIVFLAGFLLLNFGYLPYVFFKKYRKIQEA